MPDAAHHDVNDFAKDDERSRASGTLRRLVRFLASALDARYAFVSASCGLPGASEGRAAIWLARDYGLRTEFAEVDLVPPAPTSIDFASVLRLAWPHEPSLTELGSRHAVSLPLVGADGHRLGHLGVLDLQVGGRVSAAEHLLPISRRAAAELGRWSALQIQGPTVDGAGGCG